MATSIDDLNLQDVQIGTAANFRKTINDNFKNDSTGHTSIQTVVNNQVKPAITELQTKVGEWNTTNHGTITSFIGNWPNNKTLTDIIGAWNVTTYGTMTARLGGKRVLVGSGTDSRDAAKVGDLICEVGTPSS